MTKIFNVSGACRPEAHYMVDLTSRLESIRNMVDAGDYFIINRARQYGKTTLLRALTTYIKKDYTVVSLDFQTMSALSFESEESFVAAFAAEMLDAVADFPETITDQLTAFAEKNARVISLQALFRTIKNGVGCWKNRPY